ncbi:hypothetical protein RvY_16392 [Ramazzottius varieornatus]|uniref:Uncharacterized protein n=1 Tax=Ramazzottius varieornatus TaxID=947166 RepID=A0A1D1W4N9_RAMVA|nr:hypothetical protein RvY_16392 [Ramazzottius varieornatus]
MLADPLQILKDTDAKVLDADSDYRADCAALDIAAVGVQLLHSGCLRPLGTGKIAQLADQSGQNGGQKLFERF